MEWCKLRSDSATEANDAKTAFNDFIILHISSHGFVTCPKERTLAALTSSALAGFDETRDSQLPLALAFMLADESWSPKLRQVTPQHCDLAWNWTSAKAPALLSGTELEKIVLAKQRRVQEEFHRLEPILGPHRRRERDLSFGSANVGRKERVPDVCQFGQTLETPEGVWPPNRCLKNKHDT